MPIYTFKCGGCDGVIEEIRKMDDRRPAECPKCSRERGFTVSAQPIMAAPSGQFPGASGWAR